LNAADAAWSCGGGTENFLHHNCNRSEELFRPEELTQVTADAGAELLRPIIRRKLIERHLSARRGTVGPIEEA